MFTPASKNCINKLRIVGEVEDSLAFQLRLQSLLSSTDLSVPGVSPASVVCIRSLPDPRPGTLRLVRSELEGAGAWSEALTRSVAGKVQRAARPANGLVPGDADCIFFADRAEMLACLARDSLGGLLWTRWWWKILLPAGASAEVVKSLWRDHPPYVPAALDRLERENLAVPFINTLTDDDCCELLQQTVRSFGIEELGQVCEVSLPFCRVNPTHASTGVRFGADLVPPVFEQKLLVAPWEQCCGEQLTRNISPGRQRFLGITLAIVRVPVQARSREFACAVERWQNEITHRIHSRNTNLPPSAPMRDDRQISSPAPFESVDSEVEGVAPPQVPDSVAPQPETHERAHDIASRRQTRPAHARTSFSDLNTTPEEIFLPAVAIEDKSVESESEARPEFVSDRGRPDAEPFISTRESVQPVNVEAVGKAASVEIETQLGGLFYLINLALYLNLYRDFTLASVPELEINIWDFVSLVGAELTGEEDADDPIWEWLAEMSGREEGRSAGKGPEAQDERCFAREQLSVLMPRMRTRLRAALGSSSDHEAAKMLCRHYARVRATETHVDVFFVLADLPLEIRFAGLDRDPGWVPAAGRFIAFHFD